MIKKISEARYNDMVYLFLKKCFFEPIFGEGHGPRECDIRVCMQMGHKEMLKNAPPSAMILSPTEIAPKSHEKLLDVDTDEVFNECINYMEDHWMKMTVEESSGEPDVKTKMKDFFEKEIIPAIMDLPEEKCGGG